VALKLGVWAVCLWPLAWLGWRAWVGSLTANPISFVTNTLGDWTLRILLASLAMTPLRILSGWAWPVALRRLLGLFAFGYAGMHFSVWIVLDHFFDWATMGADIVKRPYITVGMLALSGLVPLAATSTAGAIRRLGGRAWRRLHALVYAVGVLAVLHYLWLAKKGVQDPYWYAMALGLLLGVRAWEGARRRLRRRAAPEAGAPPGARAPSKMSQTPHGLVAARYRKVLGGGR
jgi:sulfoxide reductase heme-binding subunit YedZ